MSAKRSFTGIWILLGLTALLSIAIILRRMRREENKAIAMHPNMQAFLWMIRVGEGTANENGYRTLFGGGLFDSFDKHPNKLVVKGKYRSTAAGAYQFLIGTWNEVALKLGLDDFSPENQTIGAIEKIRERGAYQLVLDGKFEEAVKKCAKEWASLPTSPYGQPVKTMAQAKQSYLNAGGTIA